MAAGLPLMDPSSFQSLLYSLMKLLPFRIKLDRPSRRALRVALSRQIRKGAARWRFGILSEDLYGR